MILVFPLIEIRLTIKAFQRPFLDLLNLHSLLRLSDLSVESLLILGFKLRESCIDIMIWDHLMELCQCWSHLFQTSLQKNFDYQTLTRALTPCVGWMIERMMEIVCYVPNMSVENPSLINFDKRRYIYNLITNITDMKISIDGGELSNLVGGVENATARYKKLSYLINPERTLYSFDRRTIREAATKESKEYPKANSKTKVFTALVAMEIEKTKRDAKQLENLERQSKEIKKQESRLKASSNSIGSSITDRKSSRSRLGGLLKAVRPISMAFTNSFSAVPSSERTIMPYELPAVTSFNEFRWKLLLSLHLANVEVMTIRSPRSPGLFKLMNDSTEYIFQAYNDQDADDWVKAITASKKQALTLVQLSSSYTKVFGVPVNVVCEREHSEIPSIVTILLNEIEARGLDEVGLYRIPGSLASVNALKNAFNNGEHINMDDDRWFDINTVAGCFKLYLRELPESLLTNDLFNEFVSCGMNIEESIPKLWECVNKLPPSNYHLLKRLIQHLVKVTEHGELNRMHAVNLAIVFSMSFLPSSSATTSVSNDLGAMQNVLKAMIMHYNEIFVSNTSQQENQEPTRAIEEEKRLILKKNNDIILSSQSLDSTLRRSEVKSTSSIELAMPPNDYEHNSNRDSFTEVSAY